MTSITTFAYGLTVRATDLVSAAVAWPRLEPSFRFFDLVYLRRKKGSLAGSRSSLGIPVEVWERVKRYLVTTELEDAVDSIVRGALKPDECQKRDCLESDKRRYSWGRFFAMEGECDSCDSRRYDWVANLVDGEHEFDEVRLVMEFPMKTDYRLSVQLSSSGFKILCPLSDSHIL